MILAQPILIALLAALVIIYFARLRTRAWDILAIGMCFGLNAGYAINPARDLGPRLFTALAGWGGQVFTANHYYFWVPIVGPLIGGPLGALIYDWFIGRNFPAEQN